jgi:hypothetical protein
LYRNDARSAAHPTSLLSPFASVGGLLERALTRRAWGRTKPLPAPLMVAALAGQGTAALDSVLTDSACQADASLRQLVLERTYAGWWQGLGLSDYLEVELVPR